jgi:TPR repeat protein
VKILQEDVLNQTTEYKSYSLLDQEKNNAYLTSLKYLSQRYGNSQDAKTYFNELHRHYCRHSKNGDVEAQYALAWMYENGKGTNKNIFTAEQLYRIAAKQKYQLAIHLLKSYGFDLNQEPQQSHLPSCMLSSGENALINLNYSEKDELQDESNQAPSDAIKKLSVSQDKIYKIVNKLSTQFNVDVDLVMSFILIESGFDINATSKKNAQGLMQLIPETGSRFGIKNPYKAEENIKGGMAYLEWLLAYYQGNLELVAAAYNAGEGAVDKHKGVPPYQETKQYVKKILSLYNKKKHIYREDFIKPSPICHFACR